MQYRKLCKTEIDMYLQRYREYDSKILKLHKTAVQILRNQYQLYLESYNGKFLYFFYFKPMSFEKFLDNYSKNDLSVVVSATAQGEFVRCYESSVLGHNLSEGEIAVLSMTTRHGFYSYNRYDNFFNTFNNEFIVYPIELDESQVDVLLRFNKGIFEIDKALNAYKK